MKAKFLAPMAAIVIAISGGYAFASEKKQLYFVPNGAVDFWKLAEVGMKKAQAKLPNYSIQIKYPSNLQPRSRPVLWMTSSQTGPPASWSALSIPKLKLIP
jgi:hypothetical protein